jgi:hypothetical protein
MVRHWTEARLRIHDSQRPMLSELEELLNR